MISKTGKVVVTVQELMDKYHRREDGSESPILADSRFDNHNKMTITGIVKYGTCTADTNPLEDANRIMPRCHHYPQGYVGGGVFDVWLQPGDRVWFHYLCAEDKSAMERNRDGSWDVYMQVSDIFCIERKGQMIMNQNWVLGEQIRDKTLSLVDQFGYEQAAKMTPGKGIELIKGVNLNAYVDEATIVQIDPCRYRGVSSEVKEGDHVYLSKDAPFPNVINGKQRVLFRQTDILALYREQVDQVVPVGEYHLVKVKAEEYRSTLISHRVIIKAPEYGEIIASGKQCWAGQVGDKIMFTRRWTRMLSKEYWLVADGEVLALLQ